MNTRFKSLLALLLVAALFLTLFAACGQSEEPAPTGGDETGSPAGNETGNGQNGEIDYGDEDDDELVTIEFWCFDDYGKGQDHHDRIEAALNALTEPQGLHVNITYLSFGDWTTKVQLSIGGGERIDVMSLGVGTNTVANLRANGMLSDITDELTEFAPEALESVQNILAPYTYEDRIYGLPTFRSGGLLSYQYLVMNKEVLDELGLTEFAQNMESWSEFEQILAAVTERYSSEGWYAMSPYTTSLVAPQIVNGDKFSDIEIYDSLGDSAAVIYNKDGQIGLRQAQPGYEYACQLGQSWFDKGYIYPDGLYSDNQGDPLMKEKIVFCIPCGSELGVEETKAENYGYEVVCKQYTTPTLSTGSVNFWGCGVPSTCEDKEAAVRFVNLLYTDADVMNVLVHGEEGVDYEVEDGTAVRYEDAFYNGNFVFGNNLITWPLALNGADFHERVREANENVELSPYFGFVIDTSELALTISQITTVNDQYAKTIQCGAYTEALYQEYLSKLEAAGVQDYLDAVQTQLDAWVAQQGG